MSGKSILSCKWHPGFSSPNVLVLLTSENFFRLRFHLNLTQHNWIFHLICMFNLKALITLTNSTCWKLLSRIYRADTPQEPFQVIDLNIPLVSSKNVLGESFVSFDFSDEGIADSFDDEKSDQHKLYWTAYLLIGNGQVCSCAMFYDAKRWVIVEYKMKGNLRKCWFALLTFMSECNTLSGPKVLLEMHHCFIQMLCWLCYVIISFHCIVVWTQMHFICFNYLLLFINYFINVISSIC